MLLKRATIILSALAIGGGALADEPPEVIDLNSLIPLALQRSFRIRIVDLDTQIAGQNARAATGYWDPAVRASYSEGALGGGGGAASSFNNTEGELLDLGIDANLPTGGGIRIDGAAAKFEGARGNTYASNAGISLYQPLLRDFGGIASKSRIRIAKRNYEQSQYSFQLEAISTVTQAITLYNQVALAKSSLQVAEQSRELARQLVADTAKRAELGSIETRGVEVAETRLAQRETFVVNQRRIYLDLLNELKRLVSAEALQLIRWDIAISDLPKPIDWSGDLEEDFAYAMLNRPDYKQALIDIEKAEIQARVAGNQLLPQLDLSARYFRTSFGSSYSNSFNGLSDVDSDLFVGVTFSRPILNTTASANRAAAHLLREQSMLVEQQLQQVIAIQLDNAARRIEAEAQSRELTSQGRAFAVRSLEAEERKLKLGQSTTFFVLELQEDLAEAQVRELEAIANYNIAVARYQQVKGSTLEYNGIEL